MVHVLPTTRASQAQDDPPIQLPRYVVVFDDMRSCVYLSIQACNVNECEIVYLTVKQYKLKINRNTSDGRRPFTM